MAVTATTEHENGCFGEGGCGINLRDYGLEAVGDR